MNISDKLKVNFIINLMQLCNGFCPDNPFYIELNSIFFISYIFCLALSDCKEILDKFPEAESGQYEITLWNSGETLTVNCDMKTEGGGWTVCILLFIIFCNCSVLSDLI
jgi:hypothetical protein